MRLVICLYEQAIEDLRRALAAHTRGNIEGRTREINHAILVLGYLQSSLDRDQGGQVAANLDRFYNHLRTGLVEAHLKQSAAALETQISHLMLVHEAWCEVERGNAVLTITLPNGAPSPAAASGRAASNHASSDHASSTHVASTQAAPDRVQFPADGEPHSSAEWDA